MLITNAEHSWMVQEETIILAQLHYYASILQLEFTNNAALIHNIDDQIKYQGVHFWP